MGRYTKSLKPCKAPVLSEYKILFAVSTHLSGLSFLVLVLIYFLLANTLPRKCAIETTLIVACIYFVSWTNV